MPSITSRLCRPKCESAPSHQISAPALGPARYGKPPPRLVTAARIPAQRDYEVRSAETRLSSAFAEVLQTSSLSESACGVDPVYEIRPVAHLTQRDVADYVGVSLATLLKWEDGLALPDRSLWPRLEEAMGMPVPDPQGPGPYSGRARAHRHDVAHDRRNQIAPGHYNFAHAVRPIGTPVYPGRALANQVSRSGYCSVRASSRVLTADTAERGA